MWTSLIFLNIPLRFVILSWSVGSVAPKISVNLLILTLAPFLKKQWAAVIRCRSLIREALQ